MILLADNLRRYGTYGKPEEDGLVHQGVARLRGGNDTLPAPDANGLRPESFRPPGYSSFLAVVAVCGGDLRGALLVQCLFGAAATYMVVSIALTLGLSQRLSLLAGFLWAAHPALIVFDALLLTESLFNCLSVAGLFLAARCPPRLSAVLSGLILGLAGLVRPLAVLYWPLLVAIAWRRKQLTVVHTLVQGLVLLLPSAAWACRNWAVGEGFRVTTVPDINLYYYTAAYTISEERGEDWLEAWPNRVHDQSELLEQRVRPGEDVFAVMRRSAVEELQARPGPALRVLVKSTVNLFLAHSVGAAYQLVGLEYTPSGLFSRLVRREGNESRDTNWGMLAPALLWSALNVAIVLAALCGVVRGWRCQRYVLVGACVCTIALFVLATGSVGLERMRLPIMLPLILLGASAFQAGGTAGGERSPGQTEFSVT
jgi:hypothetical protein